MYVLNKTWSGELEISKKSLRNSRCYGNSDVSKWRQQWQPLLLTTTTTNHSLFWYIKDILIARLKIIQYKNPNTNTCK